MQINNLQTPMFGIMQNHVNAISRNIDNIFLLQFETKKIYLKDRKMSNFVQNNNKMQLR